MIILQINIIRCKKLATITPSSKKVTKTFVRRKKLNCLDVENAEVIAEQCEKKPKFRRD